MIFRRDIKAQATDIGGLQSLAEWLGLNVDDLNVKGEKALKEITVFTCIKILADTLSKLPFRIYQDNNGIKKATDHYLYSLLKLRPNPYMSAANFWNCLETQRNVHGNSYAWIDADRRGKIIGLYPLKSNNVAIYVDDVGLLNSDNKIWYVVTDNLGKQYKLKSDELLHFRGFTTDGITGLTPVEMLKKTIENAKSASMFLNNSYKNGMQTKGIIQYIGEMSKGAKKTFVENFEDMSNGLKNANKVSMLPIGYQFQPISLKMTDAQFLENTQLTIRQLTAAFGIKLHQVNDLQKASYASTSEANREFYVDTLMSILNMYEQELTYKLFLSQEIIEGIYGKFNADIILRGDKKTRYETYRIGVQAGIDTPNECRALEEKEPKDGGDRLYANGSIIPLEMAGEQYKNKKGGED